MNAHFATSGDNNVVFDRPTYVILYDCSREPVGKTLSYSCPKGFATEIKGPTGKKNVISGTSVGFTVLKNYKNKKYWMAVVEQ